MEEALENLTLQELREKFLLLLDIVRCAVCLESVRQEMVQCVNGHLLCSDCKEDLIICPTCRDKFSSSKPPHIVSQVVDILPVRCKYRNCPTIIENDDEHEKYCGYKPTRCKLCQWQGPGKDVMDHCMEEHEDYCIIENQDRSASDFNICEEFSLTEIVTFEDLCFWEVSLNEPVTKMFTKIWYIVPNGKPTEKAFVTLSFTSESGPFTSTKILLNVDPDGPSEDNSISVQHRLLMNFIDEDSDLNYSVVGSSV